MLAETQGGGLDALNGLVLDEDSQRFLPLRRVRQPFDRQSPPSMHRPVWHRAFLKRLPLRQERQGAGEIDGKGRALDYGESEYVAAVDGSVVTLTIDATIKVFCEKAAREAIEVNKAEGYPHHCHETPRRVRSLAMINKPDFDLNRSAPDERGPLNELHSQSLRGGCLRAGAPRSRS
jgi:hypothetical protein